MTGAGYTAQVVISGVERNVKIKLIHLRLLKSSVCDLSFDMEAKALSPVVKVLLLINYSYYNI